MTCNIETFLDSARCNGIDTETETAKHERSPKVDGPGTEEEVSIPRISLAVIFYRIEIGVPGLTFGGSRC